MLPLITARMHNALHRTTAQLRTHRMLAYIPPFVVLPTHTLDKVSSLVVDSSINCLFSSLPLFLLPPPFVLSFRLASGSTQDSAETKKRANKTLYRNRAKQLSLFFLFHWVCKMWCMWFHNGMCVQELLPRFSSFTSPCTWKKNSSFSK